MSSIQINFNIIVPCGAMKCKGRGEFQMFLNLSKFTSLVKSAYKAKITFGNINGGLAIVSGHWGVWLENDYVPNKIKAIVMELAGELPNPGMIFEVSKTNPDPQIVDRYAVIGDLFESVENADQKMVVTPIVLKTHREIRLLQMNHNGKAMIGIPEEQFQIINKYMIDPDVEGEPTGPCCSTFQSPIYWHNSICTFVIMPIDIKSMDQDILNALADIDFFKKCKEE